MVAFGAKHWIGLGAVVFMLAGLVVVFILIRKHMLGQSKKPQAAFSLEQLRQMHKGGQISENEYNSLKEKVIRESK